jgi:tetratricopeptide (TPR) repeat protein
MKMRNPGHKTSLFAPALVAVAGLLAAGGCAAPASAPQRAVPQEIGDESGFVIAEELKVSPEVRADFELAVAMLEQERYEQGIALLIGVTERAPDATAAHIDLGIAYRKAEQLDRAEASLRRALELNPRHPVAHNEMGMICRRTGRFKAARMHYEQALAVYPGFHFARRNLAVLCDIYLADTDCALENYDIYTEAVPDDEEAAMWVADLRHRAGRQE